MELYIVGKINLKVERTTKDVKHYQIDIKSIPNNITTALVTQYHISLDTLSELVIHISANDIIDQISFACHEKEITCSRYLDIDIKDTCLSGMTIQYFAIDHAPI